ncbi:hypothetical protein Tco_0623013 [Tanacetum coccineum]
MLSALRHSGKERLYTSAGNPVKEILLKLNLPDHRSILTDSKEYIKMDMERRSVKVKELRERCIITAFKSSNQEKDVATLYISSIDLGIFSYKRLINSGWVIPCMNPEIFMHSGAPSTSRTSALYLSIVLHGFSISLLDMVSLSNQTLAFPVSVELNIWHHVGIAHLSVFAADWNNFKRSSGSPLPSYVLTWLGILVLGKSKCRIRGVKGDLPSCLYSPNICCILGAMCPCDDASLVALWFPSRGNCDGCQNVQMHFVLSPQPIEYTTLLPWPGLGEGGLFRMSLLKTLEIGDGLQECLLPCFLFGYVRAVGVLDSE